MDTTTREGLATAVNTDAAGEWADANARRWLAENPMDALDPGSPVDEVLSAVAGTIDRIAASMAAVGRETGHDASTNPAPIRAWLADCCNAMAEPDAHTRRSRLGESIGEREPTPDEHRPLRRWCAGTREQIQTTGIRWMRGRADGELALDVIESTEGFTIIEHGWPADERELTTRMTRAVAEATSGAGRRQGHEPAPETIIARKLVEDAAAYARSPNAQTPRWLKKILTH